MYSCVRDLEAVHVIGAKTRQRLEGSHFIGRQFCELVEGGSPYGVGRPHCTFVNSPRFITHATPYETFLHVKTPAIY
jgi:hypothetical protein